MAGFYNVYSWLRETLGVELLVVSHNRACRAGLRSLRCSEDERGGLQVPIAFPVEGEEDVLGPVREALRLNGSRVSVAVFSHIASMPVLINPVKKLVELCHDNNGNNRSIPVVVDGAHAPGSHNQSSLPNMAASLRVIPIIIMPSCIETAWGWFLTRPA